MNTYSQLKISFIFLHLAGLFEQTVLQWNIAAKQKAIPVPSTNP